MSSSSIAQAKAWYWQRISAMVLTIFVVVHLTIMIIAIRDGLTAAEILSRTQGSIAFGLFYALFVLACAVHVPIGVAKILEEWLSLSAPAASLISKILAAVIVIMGLTAVWGVV
ncbi:succinate dehydrogenase [beta proteobacterium MWH-UniP1]